MKATQQRIRKNKGNRLTLPGSPLGSRMPGEAKDYCFKIDSKGEQMPPTESNPVNQNKRMAGMG